MSLLDRIKSYFSPENVANDPSLVSFADLEPLNTQKIESTEINQPIPYSAARLVVAEEPVSMAIIPNVPNFQVQPVTDSIEWPNWLQDETLLRDEGVIFGLSSSKSDEKVAIIRTYFAHQSADLEREVERHGEKIQELNLFIEQKENRIEELKSKTNTLESRQPEGEHQLPRTVVGLLFSVAMCVGNYYLIEDTLRPLYGNSQFIAVGVFLAGMFNLFGRVSLFHESEEKNLSWRRLLEEVGMPLAAAFFVFVQALQPQGWLRAGALLVFVFFLFLFAGKLLLSNITLLRNDLKVWLTGKNLDSEKKDKTQTWDDETVSLQNQIDDLRVQKWQILPSLNRAEAEVSRLNSQRDMLIKSFESEFSLARQLRDQLTDRQLREITSLGS